jgi:hypothetical protein
MKLHLRGLSKKLRELEQLRSRKEQEKLLETCNCREFTFYHSAADLRAILEAQSTIPCLVHGVRNLGCLKWQWHEPFPLLPEDWQYCCCPPNAQRDYAMGKRPSFPTPEENDADFQRMVKEHPDGPSSFQEDRCREEAITLAYYKRYAEMVEAQTKASDAAREIRSSEPAKRCSSNGL